MRLFRTKREFFDAIAAGNMETINDYLSSNKNKWLGKTIGDDDTPAHIAAKHGQLEALRLILKESPKQAATKNADGRLPLHHAAYFGKNDIVRELIDAHGQAGNIHATDHMSLSPLQDSIKAGHVDILQIFLDTKHANLSRDTPPALYFAVENRKRDCVQTLLKAGANPNTPYVEPVRPSISIFFYSDPHKTTTHSPLMRAIEMNETDIALDLMDAGGKTEKAEHPLHAAALNANVHLAHALLEGRHIDVNRRNHENRTALHVAAERNVPEMVQYLLNRGAATDILDIDGLTPLDTARKYARTEIIDMMQGGHPQKPAKPADRTPPTAASSASKPHAPAHENQISAPSAPDVWTLNARRDTLVHTHTVQDGARQLTEIFNFATRERVVISENLKTRAESMGPHESFDTMSEETLTAVWEIFKAKGGKANEADVFRGRIFKMPQPKRK